MTDQQRDHETEIRTKLAEASGGIDIAWARRHLTNFGKYKDQVDAIHADEERYRTKPGYVPQT